MSIFDDSIVTTLSFLEFNIQSTQEELWYNYTIHVHICVGVSFCLGNNLPLLELKKKSGAEVDFDKNLSPVPGMKILIIRGNPHQIEKAINLMNAACGIEVCIAMNNIGQQ